MSLRRSALIAAVSLGLALVPISAHAVSGFNHVATEPTLQGANVKLVFISRAPGTEGHGHDITLTFHVSNGKNFSRVVKPMGDGLMDIPLDYKELGLAAGDTITQITGLWSGVGHSWGGPGRPSGDPFELPLQIVAKASTAKIASHLDALRAQASRTPVRTSPTPAPASSKVTVEPAATTVAKVPAAKPAPVKQAAAKPAPVLKKTAAKPAPVAKAAKPAPAATAVQAQLNAFARIRQSAGR